jgi:hypothetical protein
MTLLLDQNAPYAVVQPRKGASGFTYDLIKRVGDIAIYSQSKNGLPDAYEVVRIQKHEAFTAFGKDFPAGESYPSSNQWGDEGWTYTTLPAAERKFSALLARLDNARLLNAERAL